MYAKILQKAELQIYNHPEVDKMWDVLGYVWLVSKIIFYLLQDPCHITVSIN